MGRHQITDISKPNGAHDTHEHIEYVYYTGSWHSVEEVIRLIDSGRDSFFVRVGYDEADVMVVHRTLARDFIKTYPDNTGRDNLLSLPNHYPLR